MKTSKTLEQFFEALYAQIIQPIQQLTKKDAPFIWTPKYTNAICKLKAIVTSDLVLQWPDHKQPFKLKVDASQYALEAILYQQNDGGKL